MPEQSSGGTALLSRNEVSDERAALNRERGGWTFNAFPPDDYEGIALVYACVRLGDHAHVEVYSGRNHPQTSSGWRQARLSYGYAGHLVLRWPEWLAMREMAELVQYTRIAEIEYPSVAEIEKCVKGQGDERPSISHEEAARLWAEHTPPKETCS